MTTLSFDKFFDLQSFLMVVVLLLLLYENENVEQIDLEVIKKKW